MKDLFRVSRMWRPRGELKRRYDVVVIGGGSHGLATAYYLAKNHGIRNVAVLEQSYIGSGASGRNTTIVRSNYRTPEGAEFYGRSVKLYERLSAELDFNLMFSQRGHLTLAHSDRAMNTMQERAEVNQLLGIDSRVVLPDEIARLCPQLDLSDKPTWPIMGALYHAPGGIIRHDAVVWGLARGADRRGVEIHPYTQVTGIEQADGRVTAVQTNRGPRRGRRRGQRRRRLVDARLRPRRRPAPDHDAHPPGLRHRAGEAVPRRGHRLGADARLRLADRPRRVPDRRRDRALHDLQVDRDPPVPRVLRAPRARALPAARAPQRAADVDRASATCRPTTARSSARPSSRTSTSRPAGAPTASRPRRSSARRSPSSSRPGRRPP